MSDSEPIIADINFGLPDYLALQLWIRRQSLLQTTLFFSALLFGTIFVSGYTNGESTIQIVRSVQTDWQTFIVIFLLAFFVCYALPFLTIIYCWTANKLPRKANVTITEAEIRYRTTDHQLTLQWQSIVKAYVNSDALILRTKSAILRLPTRVFTANDVAEIGRMIAVNVSAARSSP